MSYQTRTPDPEGNLPACIPRRAIPPSNRCRRCGRDIDWKNPAGCPAIPPSMRYRLEAFTDEHPDEFHETDAQAFSRFIDFLIVCGILLFTLGSAALVAWWSKP